MHDLNAHRIHRIISGLKDFDLMGFRPRVRAVGPAGLAYALAASHEAMSARPNAAALWPLKDVCERLRSSGSHTGLLARTGSPNAPTRPCEAYPQSRVLLVVSRLMAVLASPSSARVRLVYPWFRLRPSVGSGSVPGPQRVGLGEPGSGSATFWPDSSVVGPAPDQVSSV